MVRRLIASTVVAMTIVAGCSAPSPTPGPSDSASSAASPDAADLSTAPPYILNLSVTTEDPSAVVGSIGPDGGQLSTTAADGTTYTLDIPSGALLYAEDISMTPIVGVDGLPGGISPEHLVGVQLAPDGLELFPPATLTVTPPSPIPVASVATMSFKGDGADAGLELFDQAVSNLTIQVAHFSGYVSFWPVNEEWWERADRTRRQFFIDDQRDTLIQQLGAERQKQLMLREEGDNTGLPLDDIISGLATKWDAKVFGPLRRLAPSGCRFADEALRAYVVWEQLLQQVGLSVQGLTPEQLSQTTDEQRTLHEKIRREPPAELLTVKRDLCFEEEFQRCRRTGDFEHLVAFFLRHFQQIEFFGKDVSADDIDLAHLYLERCGLWDLTMESIEDLGPVSGHSALIHQTRTYPIRWHPGPGLYGLIGTHLIGDGATEIVGVVVTHARCRVTNTYQGTAPPDTAEIERLIFDQREYDIIDVNRFTIEQTRRRVEDEPVPRKVDLGLGFGDQTWTRVQVCPGQPTITDTFTSLGGYLSTVLYERDALNKHEWRFDSGPFGDGPFSAKMTITDTFTDTYALPPVPVDVEVIITLEHTPST
jgi:hypothetical protein